MMIIMNQQLSSRLLFLSTLSAVHIILGARIDGFISDTSLAAEISRLQGGGSPAANSSGGSLVWQPLRATFRPLNRQQQPPVPPAPPVPPTPPVPPQPEALALASSTDFVSEPIEPRQPSFFQPSALGAGSGSTPLGLPTPAPAAATSADDNFDHDDEQPTRVPLNRFRPTRAPSVDPQANQQPARTGDPNAFGATSGSQNASAASGNQQYRISQECFECICEASTSCNVKSRCQTSDVRHTRCGLFLISYDQWLDTGLSKQLVTREALARDAAADERAFYECVTDRECAERLMAIYMQRNGRDCDKDGRIDCYDVAAIHQGGTDGCASESLLDSQYWSDFNACFGFGR